MAPLLAVSLLPEESLAGASVVVSGLASTATTGADTIATIARGLITHSTRTAAKVACMGSIGLTWPSSLEG